MIHLNCYDYVSYISSPWNAALWDEVCGLAVAQCVPPPQWFCESSGSTSGGRPPYGQAQLGSGWPWPAVQLLEPPLCVPSVSYGRPVRRKSNTHTHSRIWFTSCRTFLYMPLALHLLKTHSHFSWSSFLLTCKTIFLWMANFAMMWARSRWPLYLQAGSTQALGRRHGQAKVIRRRSLLLRDLLLSWMWWGACSTSKVENCSRQIRRESSKSACFSGSRTLQTNETNVGLSIVYWKSNRER